MRQCIWNQHQNGHFGEMCRPNDTRVCIDWAYRKNIPDKYTKMNKPTEHMLSHACDVSCYFSCVQSECVPNQKFRCCTFHITVLIVCICCLQPISMLFFFCNSALDRFSAYYFVNFVAFHSNMTSCFGAKREILCRGQCIPMMMIIHHLVSTP